MIRNGHDTVCVCCMLGYGRAVQTQELTAAAKINSETVSFSVYILVFLRRQCYVRIRVVPKIAINSYTIIRIYKFFQLNFLGDSFAQTLVENSILMESFFRPFHWLYGNLDRKIQLTHFSGNSMIFCTCSKVAGLLGKVLYKWVAHRMFQKNWKLLWDARCNGTNERMREKDKEGEPPH